MSDTLPFPVQAAQDPYSLAIERVEKVAQLMQSGVAAPLDLLLPALFRWENKPYTLNDHFHFEPLFLSLMAQEIVLRCARQVGKTLQIAVNGAMLAAILKDYKVLYITPLFEQTRRLSSNIVKPLIEQSPVRSRLIDISCERNVLQRSFRSRGRLQFTFALLDCDRTRGLSEDQCVYDESQDMNASFVPIIDATMSHSNWHRTIYAGTPKTPTTLLEGKWLSSSMAEWFIRCGCGKWNIPSLEHDLLKMIGPARSDISPESPGLVCADCGRPIFAHTGCWVHRNSEPKDGRFGYHIPQPIVPFHYNSPDRWRDLWLASQGSRGFDEAKFHNEILGEASGMGINLITRNHLIKACNLNWPNTREPHPAIIEKRHAYLRVVLSVDWGGGGIDGTSRTTLAVLGILPNGHVHVLWGNRLVTRFSDEEEAAYVAHVYQMFRCDHLVHDYTGAGDQRETILMHHDARSADRILRVVFGGSASRSGVMVRYYPADEFTARDYFRMDRTRSLQSTCAAIRTGYIHFFQFDWRNPEDPGLVVDFEALQENYVETPRFGQVYTIIRNPNLSDDFAMAVNMGALMLWHATDLHPKLKADFTKSRLSRTLMGEVHPPNADKIMMDEAQSKKKDGKKPSAPGK